MDKDGTFGATPEFQAIFTSSLDAILVTTLEGQILRANPAACRMLARGEDDIRRDGRLGLVDTVDPRMAVALRVRERTGRFQGELTFLRRGREPFPVEVFSQVFLDGEGRSLATIVFRDLSDRKAAEASLRSSEEKFAQVFHTSPDGVSITRLADGRYLEVNKGFEALTGYRAEEVLGRTSMELGVWTTDSQREEFVRTLQEKGEVINLEVDFAFKGGVVKTTLVSARRLDFGGTPCILSTSRDITEKIRLTETLQRTQKLESIGLLAGGIAHDFNNMLGGIFGFLQVAQENLSAGHHDQVFRNLEKALGIHGRAKGLTQQLLTFSKGGAPVRKPVDLGPLLRASATFALSGSNLRCQFDIGDLWSCHCDEAQIGQVVDNLVLNAKQAMPEGGVLSVAARNRLDPPGRPGPYLEVSVADQGPGIRPEDLGRIFDPFFSTKATGHGLGLSTVDSILRRHDGWIEVESSPGKGAVFRFFLPADPVGPVQGGPPLPVVHRGTGTLLLLDDEEAILEVLGEWLPSLGYQAVACRQGDEAVDLYTAALTAGSPFAAAILDLTIRGGRGGAEVARELRKRHPGAVLIASSGYSEGSGTPDFDGAMFSGMLVKPFLKQDLVQILSRLLG